MNATEKPTTMKPVYHHGIWFIGDSATQDWLGILAREDGKWKFCYRFRYYADEKTFDSKDEKRWYGFAGPDDSEDTLHRVLKAVNGLLDMLSGKYGSKPDFVELKCFNDDPRFMFELATREWARMKQMKV